LKGTDNIAKGNKDDTQAQEWGISIILSKEESKTGKRRTSDIQDARAAEKHEREIQYSRDVD